MGEWSYPRERSDGFDVAGFREAAGENDAQVLAWALGGRRYNAQTENTREIQPPSPPHSPGTAQPSSPTRQDQFVASPRERMWWWWGVSGERLPDGIMPGGQSSKTGKIGPGQAHLASKPPAASAPGERRLLLAASGARDPYLGHSGLSTRSRRRDVGIPPCCGPKCRLTDLLPQGRVTGLTSRSMRLVAPGFTHLRCR